MRPYIVRRIRDRRARLRRAQLISKYTLRGSDALAPLRATQLREDIAACRARISR